MRRRLGFNFKPSVIQAAVLPLVQRFPSAVNKTPTAVYTKLI